MPKTRAIANLRRYPNHLPGARTLGERAVRRPLTPAGSRAYWLYMVAGSCCAADLGASTAVAVIASLALGRAYDRIGIGSVVGAVIVTTVFSPLVLVFLMGSRSSSTST